MKKLPLNFFAKFQTLYKSNSFSKKIPGGLAKNKKPSDFDAKELLAGTKVEIEHTDSVQIAIEIAMDHLTEDPLYYQKLKKIEKK